jgi:hypothetical protein
VYAIFRYPIIPLNKIQEKIVGFVGKGILAGLPCGRAESISRSFLPVTKKPFSAILFSALP